MNDGSDPADWGSAVCVHIGKGPAEFIHNEQEALDYLYARWPLTDGPHTFGPELQASQMVRRH